MTPWSNENLSSGAHTDPYAAPELHDNPWPTPVQAGDDLDYFLPPPNPAERLSRILAPRDERRLALNVALTAAGIPPMPEDRAVIDQLSALPADVNTVLQRWLHHAL
ncbi:hypothetical protein [Streptomyces phaeochromogenes]|uniref:hypothetical protein n=1 Tax=Streptomyces phaeochromogenes TaxID=1923 RepID=UPI0033D46C38|nr:hypothetical protein OG478_01530 [Streptomyces phaeochromogenes]WSW11760.1 hypothetical protein OG277_01245 [Streptomyces phaeochromogenes]WTA01360.1 hypothetical protein OHB08_02950 [Streptomyces phaeochromogenes]